MITELIAFCVLYYICQPFLRVIQRFICISLGVYSVFLLIFLFGFCIVFVFRCFFDYLLIFAFSYFTDVLLFCLFVFFSWFDLCTAAVTVLAYLYCGLLLVSWFLHYVPLGTHSSMTFLQYIFVLSFRFLSLFIDYRFLDSLLIVLFIFLVLFLFVHFLFAKL